MNISSIEYLENRGFIFKDFTNKFKSFEEFEKFKDIIQNEEKNNIYYFDLNKSIKDIKKYYQDKIFSSINSGLITDIFYNRYLILFKSKYSIIENEAILTKDNLNSLVF